MPDDEKEPSRGFEISARSILQLGGELISSDGIAIYELIKNAVDAGSEEVHVDVTSRLPHDAIEQAREAISRLREEAEEENDGAEGDEAENDSEDPVGAILSPLAEQVVTTAPGAEDLLIKLGQRHTLDEAEALIDGANWVRFRDTGHGMDMTDLRAVYLRIGTPVRLIERRSTDRVILGEKGIGRLSVMRLGSKVFVETSRAGDKRWSVLRIDWRDFERDLTQLLQDVPVGPERGGKKEEPESSGTTIFVTALRSHWTEEKLRELAATDLSRAMDPFAEKAAVPIRLSFNGSAIALDRLNDVLFQNAHAVVTAEMRLRPSHGPVLTGEVDYRLRGRKQEVRLEKNDLYEAAGGIKPFVLERLGPFKVRFYWFNRQALDPIEGIGTVKQVRKLIAQWSGGLMVYRDGYRVPPYGGPEDDWLDLDRTALSYKSYKMNRAQIIGKVDITSRSNPHLIDQTNREGLADCPEKSALIALLQNLIGRQVRSFFDQADQEYSQQNTPTFEDIEERFEAEEKRLKSNISTLRKIAKEHSVEGLDSLVVRFSKHATQIGELIKQTRSAKENLDRREDRLMELAGIGLMVEILAHELNRSVVHSLKGLGTAITAARDGRLTSLLRTAEVQLKSLQKRISVLDRLSVSGRQRNEVFNPEEVVRDSFDGRAERFARHGITAKVDTAPPGGELKIRMIKGMFYQIIENLVENSVYWLKSELQHNPSFKPSITIKIDTTARTLFYSDNGPGIDPVNAERIFTPYFTLKKKGQGKGLGLYISQEYAKDQGLSLTLSPKSARADGRLNTFVLNLAGAVKE